MKNENASINLNISIIVASVLFFGVLVGVIYQSNYNNKININPTIIVSDSTDLRGINKYSGSDVKYAISESIQEVVSREFNRTTNYLNFTIVLFAIFLTLILVVFGFFTVRKMTEAKALLDEILATPDAVMKKYYENELNELIPNLISSTPAVKLDTIQRLFSNTQLTKEKHYELLSTTMEKEYDNITSYSTMNVVNLFDILCRLDYSKTVDLGYKLFDIHFLHRSMDFIIPLLLESTETKHKDKFRFYLCDPSNAQRTNKLIQNVENFYIYDLDTLKHIIKHAPENIVFRILNTVVQKRKGEIDLIPIIENFGDNLIAHAHFSQTINLLRQNEQFNNDNISRALQKIIRMPLTLSQGTEIIRQLNSYILDDNTLTDSISIIKNKIEPESDMNAFFKKIKREGDVRLKTIVSQLEETLK